jgi:catechol 2,3-dioxygenase
MSTTPFGIAPPSFRLPDETRIGRVHLQVADLQRSIEYYTGVLGFRLQSAAGGSAELGAYGDETPVLILHERSGARPVPRGGLLGLYHFAILLPDRAALGRFVQHIGNLGVYAGSADHAVSESLYLTDPDGLGIEVYADRPPTTWQVDGSEVHITVEPLDLRDLVQEAGGTPWTGLPAGTVIGHMHLSVGELEEASTLYHAALGFDKTAWSFPGALFLAVGGYHHHLGTNVWAAGAPVATDEDARLLEWDVVLPAADVEKAAQSLTDAGYRVTADGADRIVVDPWGSPLRLRARSS